MAVWLLSPPWYWVTLNCCAISEVSRGKTGSNSFVYCIWCVYFLECIEIVESRILLKKRRIAHCVPIIWIGVVVDVIKVQEAFRGNCCVTRDVDLRISWSPPLRHPIRFHSLIQDSRHGRKGFQASESGGGLHEVDVLANFVRD